MNLTSFMTKLKILLSLALLTLLAYPVRGRADSYYFKQFSLAEGLSQSYVTAIAEDINGNYWFGTKNGLNKLSDNGITCYYAGRSDNSFSEDYISLLKSDSQGNLWISAGIELFRYDFANDSFIRIVFEGSTVISDTCLECPGGIYFGSVGMVLFYNYATRRMEIACDFREQLYNQFLHLFAITPEGNLILTDFRYRAFETKPGPDATLTPRPEFDQICTAVSDDDGALWISRYNRGLSHIRYRNGLPVETERYTTGNSKLTNNTILNICRSNGKLWIATDGGGINIFDPLTGTFAQPITHNERVATTSLPSNSITALYNDSKGNIWAGSVWDGAINIRKVHMHTFDESPGGLSCGTATSIWLDEQDSVLWVGTDGGGLNRLDLHTWHIDRIPTTRHKKVITLTEFSEKELLAYVYQEGMVRIDKRDGTLRPFVLVDKPTNDSLRRSNAVIELYRFDDGRIGMFGNIRHIYNPVTHRFQELMPPEGITNPQLIPIGSDACGNIVLTCNQIVIRYTSGSSSPELIYTNPEPILAAACEGDTLWLGDSNGLKKIDTETGTMTIIPKPFNMTITSIVCVKESVWIGTNRGIFRYMQTNGKFAYYDESDGAITNEYIRRAVVTSPAGDVFMGGAYGLLYISADIPDYQEQAPLPMDVGTIQINGRQVEFNNQELKLPYDYTSFHLDLRIHGADVIETKHLRYYIIEGKNTTIIESSQRSIDLSNLKPGHYTLCASYYMQAGTWSPRATIVRFQVRSPWWQRWWMPLLLLLAASGIAGASIYVLDNRRKRRMQIESAENNRRLAEEKVRFLINMSHELRTPLTLIYAPLKRFVEHPSADDSVRRALAGALEQVVEMTQLANMVIDVRKMEVGNSQIEIERHNLKEWIEHVANAFRNEFEAKGLTIDVAFRTDMEVLNFDEMKCRIVLSNLLMNALKYSGGDIGKVTIEVTTPNAGYARIAVIDCGMGLGEGDPERLFERFYQGNAHSKGAGIGLSYAKMLIDMHGGQIGAYNNTSGKGATFWFDIPTNLSCETRSCREGSYFNELIGPKENETREGSDLSDLAEYSIALVDDNADMIDLLQTVCKPVFKSVYTACDGVQALEMIRSKAPDIIVSDVMMPRMDGYELCRHVKNDLTISHIPIILLTARNDRDSSATGYKMGADIYLPKPFDPDFLLLVVANQIRNRLAVRRHWNDAGARLSPEKMTFSNADEKFLTKLNGIILEHLSDSSLNVSTLTNAMGISRSVFYNKMKKLTDTGIMDYIAHIRIEKAREVLRSSEMSISEIATLLGFENASYFSTVFKRLTGQTPTQYRQKTTAPDASAQEQEASGQ